MRSTWKKSAHVLQTVAEPPYSGSSSLATSGSTTNSRPAPIMAVAL